MRQANDLDASDLHVELVGIALLENKRKQTGWLLFVDNRLRAIWTEFMVVNVNVVR